MEEKYSREQELLEIIKVCLYCSNEALAIRLIEQYGFDIKEEIEEKFNKNRYDSLIFKHPFRVGKKQGKAVLDANGLLVTFMTSDVQANLFCKYLNRV